MDFARLDPPLRRFCDFYQTYSPEWLPRLGEVYAPKFDFLDPFGEIHDDLPRLTEHFGKLFKLAESRFVVDDAATGQDGCYVHWTWVWRWKPKKPQKTVPGVTHLRFADDGRVRFHQDLFDAAEGFFDVVPVVGGLMRAVKKRM